MVAGMKHGPMSSVANNDCALAAMGHALPQGSCVVTSVDAPISTFSGTPHPSSCLIQEAKWAERLSNWCQVTVRG